MFWIILYWRENENDDEERERFILLFANWDTTAYFPILTVSPHRATCSLFTLHCLMV